MNPTLTDDQIMTAIQGVCGFGAAEADHWRSEALIVGRAVERAVCATLSDAAQAPVAVIGSGWQLLYADTEPLSAIVERHGLKIGAPLYASPAPSAAIAPSEDRADALQDMAFVHGLQAGYQFGLLEDHERYEKCIASRDGYLKVLRETRSTALATDHTPCNRGTGCDSVGECFAAHHGEARCGAAKGDERGTNGIPATLQHDEGAIARCSYCGRYSLDPKTLSARQPKCDCGERHGWSGSFEKPGRDAKWSGAAPGAAGLQASTPKLSVWYGSMPESNGKSNWTAILHNGDIASGMTIDRSEYPDRVRYEADRVRWLVGELTEEPFILDYDADKHSGYVAPQAPIIEGLRNETGDFKNFHRALCERFGYVHDERDWRRDQVSLIEWIAAGRKAATLTVEQREALKHLVARGSTFPDHNGREQSTSRVDYRHLQVAAKVLSAVLKEAQ